MRTALSAFLHRWSPRTVFGADAAGALLTAVTVGVVLPRFARELRVDVAMLRVLAAVALLVFCYSLATFLGSLVRVMYVP